MKDNLDDAAITALDSDDDGSSEENSSVASVDRSSEMKEEVKSESQSVVGPLRSSKLHSCHIGSSFCVVNILRTGQSLSPQKKGGRKSKGAGKGGNIDRKVAPLLQRHFEEQRTKTVKKKSKSKKNQVDDGKRRIVRGVVPKRCVFCLNHSSSKDPNQMMDEDSVYGPVGDQPLAWDHPRADDGEGCEGSSCYWCRRLHRSWAYVVVMLRVFMFITVTCVAVHKRHCKALVMTMSVGELMVHLGLEKTDEDEKSNQELWDEKRETVIGMVREKGLSCQISCRDLETKVTVVRQEETGEEEWQEGTEYRQDKFDLKWPPGSAARTALTVTWFDNVNEKTTKIEKWAYVFDTPEGDMKFKLYNKKSAKNVRELGDRDLNSAADQEEVYGAVKQTMFDHSLKGHVLSRDLGEGLDPRRAKEEQDAAKKRKLTATLSTLR